MSGTLPLFASGVAIGPSGAVFSIYTYIYMSGTVPLSVPGLSRLV